MKKKDRKKTELFSIGEVSVLLVITTITSFVMGMVIKCKPNKISLNNYEKELLDNYNEILDSYYKDINPKDLVSSAIEGMIYNLNDPYADYISLEDIDNFNILINGEYQGIGVQISYNDDMEPIIRYVFPNSPAETAGLKEDDIIIAIENENVLEKTLEEIKDLVSSYTKNFEIIYKRENQEYTTKLNKENIVIESVSSKTFDFNKHKIGYIKLDNFAVNSYNQFKNNLEKIEKDGIESLIIDLRDNTGGELQTVEDIVSLFITKENVIYQMKEKDKITKYYSKTDEKREYDIVVLVNEHSASASELMTGALKEVYGATIIGLNTFGKGTAQRIFGLENGEKYKLTTKEWLTANGNSIDKVGIEPNIKVEQNTEYYNNPTEENDLQLQKAKEYLSQ